MNTPEVRAKKLQVKWLHERDALVWAFNKAFEAAVEERDVDTVGELTILGRIAKQQ